MKALENVLELFHRWTECGVIYCHWKSNEHLLPGLAGDTDLDILCSVDSKQMAEKLMKECHFIHVISQRISQFDSVEDWLGFDPLTGKMSHLHLHYKMITGHKGLKEYALPWTEQCLQTRRLDEKYDVYIADPSLELVVLYTRIALKASYATLVKACLGKYKLSKDVQREVDYLKKYVDWDAVYRICKEAYPEGKDSLMMILHQDTLAAKTFLKLHKLVMSARKVDRRGNGISVALRRAHYYFQIRYLVLLRKKLHIPVFIRKTLRKDGLIVAFIGQDGSGKSTVKKEIEAWLSWKLDVNQFYLGNGEQYHSIQKFLYLRMRKFGGKIAKVLSSPLLVSDLMHSAKRTKHNLIKAIRIKGKHGIVLLDRFPQVLRLGINDSPKIRANSEKIKLPAFAKKCLLRFAKVEEKLFCEAVEHEPDLVFKLILSPEASISRKPSESYEGVKIKHEIIKCMKFQNADVVDVDATMDFDDEILMIKSIIWRHLEKISNE